MRFAVIAFDMRLVPAIRELIKHPDHQLCGLWASDEVLALLNPGPGVRLIRGWEELLGETNLDRTVVAGHTSEIVKACQDLSAQRHQLCVLAPEIAGETLVYELALNSDQQLRPILPYRSVTALSKLKERCALDEFGPLSQITLERVVKRESELEQPTIEACLIRDLDLLTWFGGNFDQVTALKSGIGNWSYQAHFTGPKEATIPASYILKRGERESAELSIEASMASIKVIVVDLISPLRITITRKEPTSPSGETKAKIPEIVELPGIDGAILFESWLNAQSDWNNVVRQAELIEGLRRSLTKRRTIDLNYEAPSERSNFKTQMTAGGCFLLIFTLITFIVLAGIGTIQKDLQWLLRKIAPWLLLIPLLGFLGLQLLIGVSRKPPESGEK